MSADRERGHRMHGTFKDVVFTSSATENKVKIQEKNMKKKSSFWDEDKSGSSSVVCLAACSSDGCQRG